METKICSKCGIEKDVCEFYNRKKSRDGKRPECKICSNESSVIYNKKNEQKINLIKQKYVNKNKEKVKTSKKKWFEKNPTYQKEWAMHNYKTDIIYRLKVIMRARLQLFLKSKKSFKKGKTFEIIGCTPEFLKEYIETKFTEGMSWELVGQYIHIDHIIPLSIAKTEDELYQLCHYTNLQPLWAEDNLKKSNKLLT